LDALKLFKDNEIPVIPFKGAVFTMFVYGSLSLRVCGDIDLLVQREHFLKAKDLLIRSGYKHVYFGHHEVSAVQATLVLEGGGGCIDLHYALTPKYHDVNMEEALHGSKVEINVRNKLVRDRTNWFFYFNTDQVWERAGSLKIDDQTLPIFSPEDLLLVAVINGIKEYWRMLIRVCDVAELIRKTPGIDWDYVLKQVRSMRFEMKFHLALLLAKDLLDLELPAVLHKELKKSLMLKSISCQTKCLICQISSEDEYQPDFRRITALLTMDNMIDKLRYLRYILRILSIRREPMVICKNYFRLFKRIFWQILLLFFYRKGNIHTPRKI
jgi:hypothetical protein